MSNSAVEQTAGSHSLAAAAHRQRWADIPAGATCLDSERDVSHPREPSVRHSTRQAGSSSVSNIAAWVLNAA